MRVATPRSLSKKTPIGEASAGQVFAKSVVVSTGLGGLFACMEKRAQTEHPVHDLIANRWSPRAFAPRAVPPEIVASLFEAARWAASCFNEQPWRFVLAHRHEPSFVKLLACLSERNQSWAGNAGVLCLSVAAGNFAASGKANRHSLHDVGQAVAHLALQATAQGLAVHQMAGFDSALARETCRIPEDFEPVAMIAVGYPGEPGQLSEELAQKERAPRQRRPQSEFVFPGRWPADK